MVGSGEREASGVAQCVTGIGDRLTKSGGARPAQGEATGTAVIRRATSEVPARQTLKRVVRVGEAVVVARISNG